MDKIISEMQLAVIAGRQILDVILVANEIVDEARKRRKEVLLFKVDFEKAYDYVDSKCLIYLMEKIRFLPKWCNWISECLSISSLSILVNDSPTREFKMGRGLRQGDPLSPFLFLIVAEAFNTMMKKVVALGKFQGFKFDEGSEQFSHL
ncbi:unnamed protein product [Lathyrus sativus]|nr:unnamed protein product [Lathyrus sativus]